uniref:uncharacterized protein LOC122600378 isoform X2 n=1 Tax=Erigeron canadensis TaxID=72917 RepID=UPI001CB8CC63|nr:uncharacterized protein LOC122600378 isoform X2 [Erigeron canadensis]
MAAPKRRRLLSITLLLIFFLNISSSQTLPDTNNDFDSNSDSDSDSILNIKHQQLLAKILILETSIDERSREVNSKDERIKQLETVVLEKSNSLASLRSEIQSLQKKESFDAKEQEAEANAQAGELEKQVEILNEEIAKQSIKRDEMEARINIAESKIAELNEKLEKLQRINEEQKIIIFNTELALQKAEEERIRAQFIGARHSKKLAEVYESWLPPWLSVYLVHYQSVMVTHWNVYGRPALDITVQKVLETKAQVQIWAQPYIEEAHMKWIPTIKEQWLTFVTDMEPHVQIFTAKTVEFYHDSREKLGPHITNIQTMLDPYVKEAKKFINPYINQLSNTLRPHIKKAHMFLKPYTKKVLRGYRRLSKTTLKYHHQVYANIHEMLKQNEFTRSVASNELVWFMASFIMVFPVLIILSWVATLFSKKPRRHTRGPHTSHTRRKARRVHPDKTNLSR